jgi:proteasome lid subunit RPN8/RPN11
MTLVLDPRQLDAIRRHGEADYPREACGLIGGIVEPERKVAVQLVPMRNSRPDAPRTRYLIDPEAFRRAQQQLERDGLDVVGVYHSHPDAVSRPSAFDQEHAWPWISYVIVAVAARHAGETTSWTLAADRGTFTPEELAIAERKVA